MLQSKVLPRGRSSRLGILTVLTLTLGASSLNPPAPEACTAFSLRSKDAVVMGKNYDWEVDAGMVIVNKRGVTKTADLGGNPDAGSWTSRFGSVTFNQYGRDIPQGGVNEVGLALEILWLRGTEFPPADDRIALGSTQWIQYQLDTAGSVDEVLQNFEKVRIESGVEVHFFVADAQGSCATVEFLDGVRKVHRRDQMSAPALTNHTYTESAEYLLQLRPWGGREDLPVSSGSLHRFARASALIESYSPSAGVTPVDHAFEILDQVSQGDYTQWSIVYDLTNLEIHFHTRKNPLVKTLSIDQLDFDCDSSVAVLNVHADADQWVPYSREHNLALIEHSFRATEFLSETPRETLEAVADYPERTRCQ